MNRSLYLGFFITLVLLGFVLDQLGYLTSLRTNLQSAISPIQQSITLTVQDIVGQTTLPTDVITLQNRVTELEIVNNTLVVENVRLREIERENEQLRQLLNYTRSNPQTNYQPSTVIGRSIGVDPTNLLYFVYVDVGARDGIARNMPVITDRGLVGRVVAVGPNSAQVLMLIDSASAVNAITQNNRATGVVRGNIDGTLILDRIPQGDTINPGDIVLSSGLGGNFPSKLVIGQVTEVLQRDQDLFQTARVRPTVDFGKLETLLIITSFDPIDFEAELLNQEDDN
ncbi:rod shape-determining protein MreC [Anaerolineales bacterium HSG24]|nr:rod shape-determining protein MreC [Anaerolineales bacterium HSG24]